jgi:hypothetical protein
VLPDFDARDLLPAGIHQGTWSAIVERFGGNARRLAILGGLRMACAELKEAGCSRVWIDGSFVTAEPSPGDWDGCWDTARVDPTRLNPMFLDFSTEGRLRMKAKYLTDLFPSSAAVAGLGAGFIEFFQVDKATGTRKGIVLFDLETWTP